MKGNVDAQLLDCTVLLKPLVNVSATYIDLSILLEWDAVLLGSSTCGTAAGPDATGSQCDSPYAKERAVYSCQPTSLVWSLILALSSMFGSI